MSFLKRGCGIEGNWKTGMGLGNEGMGFPRVAQEAENRLCIAEGLCEKSVRRRVGQGVGEDGLSTEDGSSITSTERRWSEQIPAGVAAKSGSHSSTRQERRVEFPSRFNQGGS